MSATFSGDGLYRTTLHRSVPIAQRWMKSALFVMLNPSTADTEKNDPTIETCLGFCKRWACSDLLVGNLFAYRSTDWKKLKKVTDPVGPDNDNRLVWLAEKADTIVCAWGNHASDVNPLRAAAVLRLLRAHHAGPLLALKINKNGSPAHPLYQPLDTELVRYPFYALPLESPLLPAGKTPDA